MPRPELPLERDGSAVRELAYWLRDLRTQSGLTYEQLARQAGYSRSTLQEALSGKRLPTLQVTLAIASACNGDEADWSDYWSRIHRVTDPDVPAALLSGSLLPPWVSSQAKSSLDVDSSATMHDRPRKRRPVGNRRRAMTLIVGVGILVVVAGGLVFSSVLSDGQGSTYAGSRDASTAHKPRVVRAYSEEEYSKNGASTFRFLDGSSPGQPLEFEEYVQVSCKIYNTTLQSAKPDGYWYRISSFPWDNHYYAVANTFLNGDPPSGPYTHNTDFKIPDC